MTDPSADLLPQGLGDRLPEAAATLTRARRAALEVMDSHGYDRVIPPLIEFEKSMAMRMDGVATRRQFRFVDPQSLRTLALRSDITVQVGRIAATSLAEAPRPLRLCYAGEIAVIAADQLDPLRQRLQLGAELIGDGSARAAGEIVEVAIEALEAAGARDISVDFTLPDLVDTLATGPMPLAPDQVDAVRRELDAKDAGSLKAVGGEAYLPLLYAAGPFPGAVEKLARLGGGSIVDDRIERLQQVAGRIGDRARLTLDPTERHGFEYQSWFGFTLYARGIRSALGRGGTYAIRGADEPATGFSLYIDPLVDELAPAAPARCVFLPLEHDSAAARRLRGEGWRTVGAVTGAEDPARLGCTHVLAGSEPKKL